MRAGDKARSGGLGGREGEDRRGAGGPVAAHRWGSREHEWSLWHVTSQGWRLQVHHLDHFSELFFTSALVEGALKSPMKAGGPDVLDLQENQPPSENGSWGSLCSYYHSHLLYSLLSKFVFRTSSHVLWVSTIIDRLNISVFYFHLVEILGIFAGYHRSFLEWGGAQNPWRALLTEPSLPPIPGFYALTNWHTDTWTHTHTQTHTDNWMTPFPQKYSGFCLAAFQSYWIQFTAINMDFSAVKM